MFMYGKKYWGIILFWSFGVVPVGYEHEERLNKPFTKLLEMETSERSGNI